MLLVTQVIRPESLTGIERTAAQRGARVSVVTHRPGDDRMAELLPSAGYKRTTDYFEGSTVNLSHGSPRAFRPGRAA